MAHWQEHVYCECPAALDSATVEVANHTFGVGDLPDHI